jgi:hypothetical protein
MGTDWQNCTGNPVYIGDVDISAGDVLVRVRASNDAWSRRFYGENLASDADFTIATGIAKVETEDILLYPNPVTKYLRFQMKQDCQLESVRILSPTGIVLMHVKDIHSSETLNISGFSPGLYIVEVKTESKVLRTNIIKN